MSNKLLMDGLYANRVYMSENFKETLDENFCSIDIERDAVNNKVHYMLFSNTNYMNTEQIFSHMSINNSIDHYYDNIYSKIGLTLILSVHKEDALEKLGKLRQALYK